MWERFIEYLLRDLNKGGLVLIPIYIVAQIGWFLALERIWKIKKWSLNTNKFWKEAPDEIIELETYIQKVENRHPHNLITKIFKAIYSKKHLGEKAMVLAFKEELSFIVPQLQRHDKTLAILANTAPLLGLLGTIMGIVAVFKVITLYGNGNPAMMAGGISEALITTQQGLVVSFPLMLMHNYIVNRSSKIESHCIAGGSKLINLFRKHN